MNSTKSSLDHLALPPLSLYIHIPWCIKKCPYCDFNSHQKKGELPEKEYIARLIEDLKQDSLYIQNRPLHSIFIGGGTPSLFSAESFDTLLNAIQQIVPFENDIEITLEANPGTFEQQKFSDYRLTGINRLSIGIQSFQQEFLQKLGRVHNNTEAINAAAIAQQAGFNNFNLDLMFGLPQQSIKQALTDLEFAVSCTPTHISWYQLTIEPNTNFYSHPPRLPGDDTIFDMQDAGQTFLAKEGYNQYEISAYSQIGRRAAHNLNYWRFGDYLGIGAGAHGKITQAKEGHIIRTRKTRQPKHYLDLQKKMTTETKVVAKTELPLEFMMNAMRLYDGADLGLFETRTGLTSDTIKNQLLSLREQGLLEHEQLKPTTKGRNFLNDLLSPFV